MPLYFSETIRLSEQICPRATLYAEIESGTSAISRDENGAPVVNIHARTICKIEGAQLDPVENSTDSSIEVSVNEIAGNPLVDIIEQSRRKSTAATLLSHAALNCVQCPESTRCVPETKIKIITDSADLL